MQNHRDTLLAQYANSPTITALVDYFNDWLDIQPDVELLFSTIWNIETANDHGLDIWGRIVGVGRYLEIEDAPAYWGFEEAQTSTTLYTGPQPFGSGGTFYDGKPVTQTYRLHADVYRRVILWKAMSNISTGTVDDINRLLKFMFSERGRAYVHDTGDMTMRYVFEFYLTPVEKAILKQSNIAPKPAGVNLRVIEPNPAETFGFAEAGLLPFGSGIFFNA